MVLVDVAESCVLDGAIHDGLQGKPSPCCIDKSHPILYCHSTKATAKTEGYKKLTWHGATDQHSKRDIT